MAANSFPDESRESQQLLRRLAGPTGSKAWLLTLLLFLFVLPLLGGTYWMYLQSKQEIEREELQSDLLHARALSALVEQDFASAKYVLTSIAERPGFQDKWERRDLDGLKSDLWEIRKLEPAYLFASVYETNGTLRAIVPSDRIVGWNFAYRDWYRGVTEQWKPYVSEVYRTAAKPNPLVVAVAVPIRGRNNEPTGILMATYSLGELSNKFRILEKGGQAEFYVVDQHGFAAASKEVVEQSEPKQDSATAPAYRALAGSEGSGKFPADGKEVYVGYAPVAGLGWGVLYVRAASDALAPAMHLKSQHRSVALYLLLVYLATAALAAILIRRQTQLLGANQTLNAKLNHQITETKRAKQDLDRYFALGLDLFCIAGDDGYFKRLNPAWEKLLGFTVAELLARPYLDFIHPDDRESTVAQAEKQGKGEEVLSFANRYRCKDGSYKWLSWKATPVVDQGLIHAVARDVTELKKMQDALTLAKEEAERSSRFKDQFLSTMSHELRTPLNAVVGFSDLLTEEHYGPLNDRQKRYLNHIQTGGKHLLRLINDILDLSRIEAGRLRLAVENVSVKAVFNDVLDTMHSLADRKSHSLVPHEVSDLSVRADPTRFRQVLMNLLGNAIKFTPEGGRIELRARALGQVVRVEVCDTGPGIPTDERERIFEAFYRLGRTEKATEGTGLGLAITRSLVELHGGHLGIESEIGSGSCFFFTLPMAEGPRAVRESAAEPRALAAGNSKILVIEDDSKSAQLLQSQLTTAGYDVVVCNRPENALQMAAELQPAAITLDIIMKPISGWELLPALKTDPRTREVPIIVVSIVDQPAAGALLGAEEFIVKPVQKATLLAAIERCLNRRGGARRAKSILVVEDDGPTREFIEELLTKNSYLVSTAVDGSAARARVAESLPELVILDLVLPKVSGFQLLAEWRKDARTADLPVFVLTSKDLTAEEKEHIRLNRGALFHKQQPWQEDLLRHLQKVVPPPTVNAR
jgi:PAS domain S-box-containing protein